MSGRVDGKTALVTGAGIGLGRAFADRLAAEGARVAVTDIDEAAARETAAAINEGNPGAAIAIRHDVTDAGQWQAALAATHTAFGGLHILVNNAGISAGGDIESTDYETFKKLQTVDLDSVFLGCQAAIPLMRDSGGGSIINISSVVGIMGNPHTVSYGTAKAGVRYLTKSVALDCARKGYKIRCNSVHPTFAKTPLLQRFADAKGSSLEEAHETLASLIPLGEILEPEDVANVVLFLASDESRMMTGSELVIDGGLSAGYVPPV